MNCEYPGCEKEAEVVNYDDGCPYCHGADAGCGEPSWDYYCLRHCNGIGIFISYDEKNILALSEVAQYNYHLDRQRDHPNEYYNNLIVERWVGKKTLEEVYANAVDEDRQGTETPTGE